MKDVASQPHIFLRKGVWTFRRRVPLHLVAKAGRREVKKTLGTSDRVEAKRRATVEDLRFDKWVRDLEAGAATISLDSKTSSPFAITADDLAEHARNFVAEENERRAKRLLADPPQTGEELGNLIDDVIGDQQELSDPERSPRINEIAATIAARGGIGGQHPAALLGIATRALRELARMQGDRLAGDYTATHHDVLFAPGAPGAKPKVSVGALAEQFLAETREEHAVNGIAAKRTEKVEATMGYLVEALGAETRVADLDDDAMQRLRKMIARTPANRNKVFPGLSLVAQIERAEKEGKPTIQHLTQRGHFEVLRNFLRLAVRKKFLPSNPAEGLQPLLKETVPLSEKRRPFSIDQLRQLLGSAFYQACAPGAAEPYTKPDRAWRFWLPLIMLFSGCRPNEACSLTVDDIRQTAKGTWYFDFNDEGDEKSLKNSASRRRVPIHPELLRIGLLDFVTERRKTAGKHGSRLFRELKPKTGEPGNFAWYATRRFNEFFLPSEVKMEDRQSLYSIRHSVRDALRRIKASDEALFAIGGWTPAGGKAVSSNYGNAKDADLWVDEVAGIAYDGLNLLSFYPNGKA